MDFESYSQPGTKKREEPPKVDNIESIENPEQIKSAEEMSDASVAKGENLDLPIENQEVSIISHFEKNERPRYRYFYHGTFSPQLENIERSGVFKTKEYYRSLTTSPLEGFKFLDRLLKKGGNLMSARGRHLDSEEQSKFHEKNMTPEDCVILVMEPPAQYLVRSTNEGRPNFFSTPDQIPDDIYETIRMSANWAYHQYAISKEPIANKNMGEIKYPGIHPGHKMLPNGQWVKLEKEKQINAPLELPASSIKMVIKRSPEFLRIFQDMEENMNNSEKIELEEYRKRLLDYFETEQGIIEKETVDKAELADNMVTGELEHLIVSATRRLYLDCEKYKGKKFINWKTNQEENYPLKTKDNLLNQIAKLRAIRPENEVFKRYIEINTQTMEEELKSSISE